MNFRLRIIELRNVSLKQILDASGINKKMEVPTFFQSVNERAWTESWVPRELSMPQLIRTSPTGYRKHGATCLVTQAPRLEEEESYREYSKTQSELKMPSSHTSPLVRTGSATLTASAPDLFFFPSALFLLNGFNVWLKSKFICWQLLGNLGLPFSSTWGWRRERYSRWSCRLWLQAHSPQFLLTHPGQLDTFFSLFKTMHLKRTF